MGKLLLVKMSKRGQDALHGYGIKSFSDVLLLCIDDTVGLLSRIPGCTSERQISDET